RAGEEGPEGGGDARLEALGRRGSAARRRRWARGADAPKDGPRSGSRARRGRPASRVRESSWRDASAEAGRACRGIVGSSTRKTRQELDQDRREGPTRDGAHVREAASLTRVCGQLEVGVEPR